MHFAIIKMPFAIILMHFAVMPMHLAVMPMYSFGTPTLCFLSPSYIRTCVRACQFHKISRVQHAAGNMLFIAEASD